MIAGSYCDCLVCRLEKSLLAEFRDADVCDDSVAVPGDLLSAFPTYLDLIGHLHAPSDPSDSSSSDALLAALLQPDSKVGPRLPRQQLLLLVFVPTIHRTASQITAMFPSLSRDDISQQVLSVFLEFLHSTELRTRRSHLAFTIARKLRRNAFRWAIRESRSATSDEAEAGLLPPAEAVASDGPVPAEGQLREFLDSCQERGWLSLEERHLLVEFKIEGVSCLELACRNGHSAVSVQRRIQRLLDRLRRLAQTSRRQVPEQLRLFTR
jgi:DNA-directed RNA polymerase specialized sigma24 family protein